MTPTRYIVGFVALLVFTILMMLSISYRSSGSGPEKANRVAAPKPLVAEPPPPLDTPRVVKTIPLSKPAAPAEKYEAATDLFAKIPAVREGTPIPQAPTPPTFPAEEKRLLVGNASPDPPRVREHPVEHRDVCQRNGGYKRTFTRHHHESWRCVYPHRRADD